MKIRRYPCFGACDQGINVTLYPDKIFYSKVTESDLAEIAAILASCDLLVSTDSAITPASTISAGCQYFSRALARISAEPAITGPMGPPAAISALGSAPGAL